MWNEDFKLPDEPYSVSDIQDYVKYIIKKHQTVTCNPTVRIYVYKIGKRITFRINTWYE